MPAEHARPHWPRLRYRALLFLLTPLFGFLTVIHALRGGGMRFFVQRLGLGHPDRNDRPLWIHAASVGELRAVQPLLEKIGAAHPGLPLVVTTNTPTSGALAAGLPEGISHVYLPLDWRSAVERFLAAVRPRAGLVVETELWPELYAGCARRGVPLALINGRVSARTLRAPRWLRPVYADCLQSVRCVLARSETDKVRFQSLGLKAESVRVVGNIKFAALGRERPEAFDAGRPYLLAASTRDDEEAVVIEAWRRLEEPRPLLVIAPRHPVRSGEIQALLVRSDVPFAVRSAGQIPDQGTAVYLADTLGELESFIAGAAAVFVGGSLVRKGGQNVLEPARLGKPVAFGPSMENFQDEARLLLEGEAAEQVADAAALGEFWQRVSREPEWADGLARRARELVAERQDMAERYLEAIEKLGLLEARQP